MRPFQHVYGIFKNLVVVEPFLVMCRFIFLQTFDRLTCLFIISSFAKAGWPCELE